MEVKIPYHPRDWSLAFHNSKKRWIVLVIHRRAGKTTAAINHLQRDALTKAHTRYAYIAPTYKQAKAVAWDILKHYSRVVPGVEYNEAELTCKYPNGSKITLYGADNPDSLRGIGLWGVVFDEYSQQPANIFTEIIRPALADHSGYAIWIGTPKGKNEFYRLYAGLDEEGKQREKLDEWLRVLLTVEDTTTIPAEELESNRATMTRDEFAQEWYCSFEAAIKGAIYGSELALARKDGRIGIVPYDRRLKVYTVTDLGKGPNMATGFYQASFGQVKMIDCWEGQGSDGIPSLITMLQRKPYAYGKHFVPHDIQTTDLITEESRLKTAETLGIRFDIVPKMSVEDGIHAGKLMFDRLWIDEGKCGAFLDSISQYKYEWDEKRGMFKDTPLHDWTSHHADQLRYAAVVEGEFTNDETVKFRNIDGEGDGDVYEKPQVTNGIWS